MTKDKASASHKIFTIIGVVLCVILTPILIINITLIIKSNTKKDEVPSVGGYFPMIVLTDSMFPDIKSGDLIICHTIDAGDVKEKDVISFFDPAGNGSSVVTHRVVEIVNKDGKLFFRTKGDNNNTDDKDLVPAENLVGIYKTRIAGAGNIAMFMQTTTGLIVCVVLPIILLVGYDIIRRRIYEKKNRTDTDALLAELEALKAEKAKEKENSAVDAEIDEKSDK
jgi:signal peptidase I